jgi:YD repeat-containing protein
VITCYTYTAQGLVKTIADPLGRITSYDVLNRRLTVTNALNQTTTTAYDLVGNVLSATMEVWVQTASDYQ